MNRGFVLFIFSLFRFLFASIVCQAQQPYVITGKVLDKATRATLPFVNMTAAGHPATGATADIDGNFRISSATRISALNFTYVGYKDLTLPIKDTGHLIRINVLLQEASYQLSEVKILPGVNPALRIIRATIEHSDSNNPEKKHSFTYISYNKMYATADMKQKADTLNSMDSANTARKKQTAKKDTSKKKEVSLTDFFNKQYLFLVESVSERRYLYPGHSYERVIAERTSGLKNSPFALLATQLQSFSFYANLINILGDDYLNPISAAGLKRYNYILQDTLYQGKDTVFIISFSPDKKKNFNGMKGVLYINTNGFAIQNVIAEPVMEDNLVSIHIQQKYEQIKGRSWFPVQLNTDWIYNNISLGDSTVQTTNKAVNPDDEHNKIKIVTRSYIKDITLDTALRKRQFGRVEVDIAQNASQQPDSLWDKYRNDTLSAKEKKTYHVIDSLGKAAHLDRKLSWWEALSTGKLRIGAIDWDLNRVLTYNGYEHFRAGLGGHTNDKISRIVSLGGYGAYGFGDKAFKYGGDAGFLFNRYSNLKLDLSYINDVTEAGGVSFYNDNDQNMLSTEQYRKYFITNMNKIVEERASLSFDALRYFRFNLFTDQQVQQATNSYLFGTNEGSGTVFTNQFYFTEAGINIRFAYDEKFLKSPMGMISLGTKYPVVWLNITQGISASGLNGFLKGEYNYTRYDFKLSKVFRVPQAGYSQFQALAGYVQGNVPYTLLYDARATYTQNIGYSVAVDNTFETMRINEFLSSRYINMFYMHNFESYLFHIGKFKPHPAVVMHAGWGWLDNPDSQYNTSFRTMNLGYYESGLEMNNLLKLSFLYLGVGTYYRYGPYSLSTPYGNWAFKFTLRSAFN